MKEVTAHELKKFFSEAVDIQLIDVREENEHIAFDIGGTLMPLSSLFDHAYLIERDKPVIVYCKKGIRSQIAIQRLNEKFGFTNLINLKGGLDSYIAKD